METKWRKLNPQRLFPCVKKWNGPNGKKGYLVLKICLIKEKYIYREVGEMECGGHI